MIVHLFVLVTTGSADKVEFGTSNASVSSSATIDIAVIPGALGAGGTNGENLLRVELTTLSASTPSTTLSSSDLIFFYLSGVVMGNGADQFVVTGYTTFCRRQP